MFEYVTTCHVRQRERVYTSGMRARRSVLYNMTTMMTETTDSILVYSHIYALAWPWLSATAMRIAVPAVKRRQSEENTNSLAHNERGGFLGRIHHHIRYDIADGQPSHTQF